MKMIDRLLTHPQFDICLDNLGSLFHRPRRKELQLERIIAADNVAFLARCITSQAEANQKVDGNQCPLVYWACFCKSYKVLIYLLEKKVDCNQADTGVRLYPLESCAGEGKFNLIRLLMLVGNADARLHVLRSKTVTLYDMVDSTTQTFIETLEIKKQAFRQLEAQYNQQKELADNAYKQANMNRARERYRQAALICKAMANWWQEFANEENIPVIKEHYQKQAAQYLKSSQELASHAGFHQQDVVTSLNPSFS